MTLPQETRRALTRQYKDSTLPAGVFAIRNLKTGRVFTAAALDIVGAMNRQRFELNLRSHRNKALQQDWIALGAEAFAFEELARVKERDDPAFDRAAELEALFELWAEESGCHGAQGYNGPARPSA
ncbi:GIY-YIG nuclease family protein [Variovorax sp.]|uniref:GIY-YIG nuclease family protein n=1 Tax=Variovorax sp. TaxID=1871043 RepID=UPI00137D7385|nr:GIY-YIG nuclease family protein [Variovorax sp.]KAF1070015.1 MAG: hypothetical protein GAK39_02248 [Variovorax sp.]